MKTGNITFTLKVDTIKLSNALQNLIKSLRALDKRIRKDKAKLRYLKRMRNRNKLYLKNRK